MDTRFLSPTDSNVVVVITGTALAAATALKMDGFILAKYFHLYGVQA